METQQYIVYSVNEQEFIDIELKEGDSLALLLKQIVESRREEIGSYNISVQNVIPVGDHRFTIILHIIVESY